MGLALARRGIYARPGRAGSLSSGRNSGTPSSHADLAFSQLVFSVALKWRDGRDGGESDGRANSREAAASASSCYIRIAMYFVTLVFFIAVVMGPAEPPQRARFGTSCRHSVWGTSAHSRDRLSTRAYKLCLHHSPARFAGWTAALCHLQNFTSTEPFTGPRPANI